VRLSEPRWTADDAPTRPSTRPYSISGAPIAGTEIPLRAAFNDAGVVGCPLALAAPDSPGGVAYWKLAEELDDPPLDEEAVA